MRYTEKAQAGNGSIKTEAAIQGISDMACGSAGRTGRTEAGEKEN